MANKQTIGVIAGDGIGKEVIPAGMAAIQKAAGGGTVSIAFEELPWGCEYYLKHQRMLDEDGFERLAKFDAVYLGALGAPGVSDVVSAGLILAIRQRFDQYVNLRPMRLLDGISSPLANRGAAEIDMVCVRENSEGEYSGAGGRIHRGTAHEVAQQTGVFTRHGIERILRYGFEQAAARPRKMLASATKSNALTHSMVMWDEVAEIVRRDFPAVDYRKYHVDALAARMVTHPQTLDVIDRGIQILLHEIRAAPIARRPGARLRQRSRERTLIERHARDHADVQLAAQGEELIFRCLIEDVVDHLHGVDLPRAQRLNRVGRFPAIDADAHRLDQPLRFEITDGALPAFIVRPRVFPDVELQKIDARDAEVLKTLLDGGADVVRGEDIVELEATLGRPLAILWRDLRGGVQLLARIRAQQVTEDSFAQTVAIRGGSVEEIAAELHGELEGFAGLCVVGTGPAGETPHAVPNFRDLPAGAAECSVIHCGIIDGAERRP